MNNYQNCVCDYANSGLCQECPGSQMMKEIRLGGCYHTGMVYALGYDANGETELDSELFTNLDTGISGGAMAALNNHRKQFNPKRDLKRFIVALKPVHITVGIPEGEEYQTGNNPGCDICGIEDNSGDSNFCNDCIEATTCDDCNRQFDDCYCYDESNECDEECCTSCDCDDEEDICFECGELFDYCSCDEDECSLCKQNFADCTCCHGKISCDCEDELCEEFVTDTFQPMNAFVRARWIKAQRNNG